MTTIAKHIATLKTIADEMATARRWDDAHAVQVAIMQLQAMETPIVHDDIDGAGHEALLTR